MTSIRIRWGNRSMRPTLPPPRFLPVPALDRAGQLLFSGRAVHARQGGGASGDGLWREVDLAGGDRYLAVTDGITEAGRPRVLGKADLLRFLDALPPRLGPDALLRLVFALAAEYDGPTWAGDDATGLCWLLEGLKS